MPNVILKLVALGLAAAATVGCRSAAGPSNAATQDMATDDNLADQQDGNIAIETLPADESSETSNAELSAGAADPDAGNSE